MTRTLAFRNAVTIVLLFAGIVIGGVGWLVGVALLWTSPTWRLRDKILGTLIVPGGLPFAFLVGLFGVPSTVANRVPGLVAVLQVLLLLGPVVMAVRLAWVAFRAEPGARKT